MQTLTAPRVQAILAHSDRKLEITGELLPRGYSVLGQFLEDRL